MHAIWDEAKRDANLRKHGIDFADWTQIFGGITWTMADDRTHHGEERFLTFGLLGAHVVCVVHTESRETLRIISIRKATRREQTLYFQSLED